ncbi:hypothetical protein Tco_0107180, partial [Tanacetum coccineum]
MPHKTGYGVESMVTVPIQQVSSSVPLLILQSSISLLLNQYLLPVKNHSLQLSPPTSALHQSSSVLEMVKSWLLHSLSSSQVHPPVFPQGVAAEPTIEDTSITQADLHPSFNPVAGEPNSTQSTSGDLSLAEPNQVNQPPDHLRKWTKDHPLD